MCANTDFACCRWKVEFESSRKDLLFGDGLPLSNPGFTRVCCFIAARPEKGRQNRTALGIETPLCYVLHSSFHGALYFGWFPRLTLRTTLSTPFGRESIG